MANTNNIEIYIDGNNMLDIQTPESLGIKLSRKVDDMADLTKRFGDFTYSFNVTRTKNNSRIFGHPEVKGIQKMFYGKKYDCLILNNTQVLIDGVMELIGVDEESYKVVVHSKLNDFIDAAADKKLTEISTFEPIAFNYEQTIVNWINAGYKNSDEAILQFPLIFYNTIYTPYSIYQGESDDRFTGVQFYADDNYQNNYYIFNSVYSGRYNEFYYHQLPPALYLVRILEGCVNTVGWQIGGSWIQREEVKMIIFPTVGESDIYDRAGVTGSTAVLRPELFLPEDMKIIEFLSSVINAFNLYFIIDAENKTIVLEDWNTMFNTTENPYVLDNIINAKTIKLEKPENGNPTIKFGDMKKADSEEKAEFIMADSMVLSNNSNNACNLTWRKVSASQANNFYNKFGVDDEVEIEFGTPRVKRCKLWNDYDIQQNNDNYGVQTIFIPALGKQTVVDNNNKLFNKNTGHTKVYNTEDTISYKADMTMYYYIGQSTSDVVNKSGKNVISDYMYINITHNGVKNYVKIPFCTPYMISNYRDNINYFLNNMDANSINTKDIITCTYLQATYTMFKRSDDNIVTTPYSLVFDEDDSYHQTLYTVYHKKKYERLAKSNLLIADVFINEDDFREMAINRPLLYMDELYHLQELQYDPIKRTGVIRMIKDLI
jgi:hypothetical protein